LVGILALIVVRKLNASNQRLYFDDVGSIANPSFGKIAGFIWLNNLLLTIWGMVL
jgi:hypothetical protein